MFPESGIVYSKRKDSWRRQGQLMVPLDDRTVLTWLEIVANGDRDALDRRIQILIDEVRG